MHGRDDIHTYIYIYIYIYTHTRAHIQSMSGSPMAEIGTDRGRA
jgi:hypothetical protein